MVQAQIGVFPICHSREFPHDARHDMEAFPCTHCGACCRRAWMLGRAFPLKADGSCAHLRADNSCAIYAVRPAVCRVAGNFAANARECNRMQAEDGLSETFRVRIEP